MFDQIVYLIYTAKSSKNEDSDNLTIYYTRRTYTFLLAFGATIVFNFLIIIIFKSYRIFTVRDKLNFILLPLLTAIFSYLMSRRLYPESRIADIVKRRNKRMNVLYSRIIAILLLLSYTVIMFFLLFLSIDLIFPSK